MAPTPPFIGRNAVVQINSSGSAVTIGYATGVDTSLDQDLIKEYVLGQQNPAIVAPGLQSYKISCNKLYADNSFATLVSAGTACIFLLGPNGTTTGQGNPKITLSGVILKTWHMKWDQKGLVLEDVSGEGSSISFSTW
jgi:hypothetical protein